ncbi:MAG: hypothetical protein SWO11_04645 [Thermodesulfobacteriota bacterium]|nr:hypothetical protein [Thermodesulfobacteriota bacterium]
MPVKKNILECITPKTKAVEFHFENVDELDAPAMAMIGIMIKYLHTKRIASRIKGLSEEHLHLSRFLGLDVIADLYARTSDSMISKKTKANKKKIRNGRRRNERHLSHGHGRR